MDECFDRLKTFKIDDISWKKVKSKNNFDESKNYNTYS